MDFADFLSSDLNEFLDYVPFSPLFTNDFEPPSTENLSLQPTEDSLLPASCLVDDSVNTKVYQQPSTKNENSSQPYPEETLHKKNVQQNSSQLTDDASKTMVKNLSTAAPLKNFKIPKLSSTKNVPKKPLTGYSPVIQKLMDKKISSRPNMTDPRLRYEKIKNKPRLNLPVTKSLVDLTKRIAKERETFKVTPAEMKTPKEEPKKVVYMHQKTVAVLSIGANGYTLCNGVESVTQEGVINNANLMKEIANKKICVLNCIDKNTFKIWRDVKASYAHLFKNIQDECMKPFQTKVCTYCNSKDCHRWKAAAGMAKLYKFPFDPIPH